MFEELKQRQFILFAMDHYDPLGVVRSLGEAGSDCCPPSCGIGYKE